MFGVSRQIIRRNYYRLHSPRVTIVNVDLICLVSARPFSRRFPRGETRAAFGRQNDFLWVVCICGTLFRGFLFVRYYARLFVLSRNRRRGSIRCSCLVRRVGPGLASRGRSRRRSHASIGDRGICRIRRFLTLFTRASASVFQGVVSVPYVRTTGRALRKQDDFRLRGHVTAVRRVRGFVSAVFRFLVTNACLFRQLRLHAFVLTSRVRVGYLMVIHSVHLCRV